MKSRYLTLSLALIAGLVCLAAFSYKIVYEEVVEYPILMAGVLIMALGIAAWFRSSKKH